jgi:5-methylcytosine-specific restriction endonuclease McrA
MYKKRWIKRDLWAISKLCGICSKDLPGIHKSTLDHIIPLSKGGADDESNLQLAHLNCNNAKGNQCPKQ